MSDNNINVTAPLHAATKKGKLSAAKEIFLEGDTQTVEKEIQDINSRHNDLSSKHESLSSTVSEHTKQIESNQSQITANKSAQDAKNTSLDANMAKLNARDDQITELVKGVTATGGASVATAVTYDNTSSNLDAATVQGALDEVGRKTSDLSSKKANKVVRFDNAKKQYESDNKDVETANSHILEFYTDLVLSEKERLVIANITYLKSNYYINISKFNSSTNTSEDVVVKQSKLIDNGVTILNTIDGEHSIFILFVSNGDTSVAINNIGQGIARMPYATEYAFRLNENKFILSYIKTFANMLAEQTRVNTELGKKFDKSSIAQESGEAEDKVMSQKAVKKALENIEIPTYNTQKSVTVWGDSITWGSAASNSNKCYAMILKSLLAQNGVDADVVNCGVGGETFQNILVRQGAFGFYLSEDITLPHDKSEIVIQTITNYILNRKFKNTWYGDDSYFGLLLQ